MISKHCDDHRTGNRFVKVLTSTRFIVEKLKDDGIFPNNEKLPLIIYKKALNLPGHDPASAIEALFEANQWRAAWRNGIYPFHHYHSTAHEVLGVYSGDATVQLGGEKGVVSAISRSDVIVIPAGVSHKNLGSSLDFRVVGGYPQGQDWDMNEGRPGERPQTDNRIAAVPLPPADPVYGRQGPLVSHWLT